MKQFLLFGWEEFNYTPEGGFGDFKGDFDEFHDVMREAKRLELGTFHIVCSKTWQIWKNGSWSKIKKL